MKTYILFIQSVSTNEWEVGEIISCDIEYNPEYSDCSTKVFYVKTFQELIDGLKSIRFNSENTSLIVQIDTHSNPDGIAFKDVNNPNKEECYDYVQWVEFDDILKHLYDTFGTNITLIFISCHSSIFAESIKSPHIPIIAADGEISARRAEEQLIKFYEKICTGSTVKEAYDFMIELYPIEDEKLRNEKDRSILKLYNYAETT